MLCRSCTTTKPQMAHSQKPGRRCYRKVAILTTCKPPWFILFEFHYIESVR